MGTPRRQYVNKDAPKGTGQCHANASMGMMEVENRRATNAASDEQFLSALRRYELRLADKIEAELLGGLSPVAKAAVVLIENMPPAQRASFIEQLERVKNGAGITECPPIRRADYAYTLGGVSEI